MKLSVFLSIAVGLLTLLGLAGTQAYSGELFVRDNTHPRLGEAWRDVNRVIWGDVVKAPSGNIFEMNKEDAENYCEGIGARLPTWENFSDLRNLLGNRCTGEDACGYNPAFLPNLTYIADIGGLPWKAGYQFWSSTDDGYYYETAYAFDGASGDIKYEHTFNKLAVRCIVRL